MSSYKCGVNFNCRSTWDYKIQTNKSRIKNLSDNSDQGQGVTHSLIPPKCRQSKLQWWWHPLIHIWPPNMCVWVGGLTKTELFMLYGSLLLRGTIQFSNALPLGHLLGYEINQFYYSCLDPFPSSYLNSCFYLCSCTNQQFHSQPLTHSGLTNSSILGSWIIMIRIVELWLLSSRRVRMSEIQCH